MSQSSTQLEQQIRSQPDELDRIAASHEVRAQVRSVAEGLHRARRIWVVGTGTSQHAAALGALMLQETGRSALAISSMQFVGWAPNVGPQDAIIVISHTHETAYAMAARALAFNAGHADRHDLPHAVPSFTDAIATVAKETSETYTVSYTAALLVLAMVAAEHGRRAASRARPWRSSPEPSATRSRRRASRRPRARALLVFAGAGPRRDHGARRRPQAARGRAACSPRGTTPSTCCTAAPSRSTRATTLIAITTARRRRLRGRPRRVAAEAEGVGVTRLREPAPLPPMLAQIPLTVRLQMLALAARRGRGQNPDTVITGALGGPGALVDRRAASAEPGRRRLRAPRRRVRPTYARTAASSRSPTRAWTRVPSGSAGLEHLRLPVEHRDEVAALPRDQQPRPRRAGAGSASASVCSNPSTPSPVSAETGTEPGNRRASRARSDPPSGRSCSGRAPRGCRPRRSRRGRGARRRSAPSRSGEAASAMCTMRSASVTSSRVERNASTRSCGSLLTKPDRVADRRSGGRPAARAGASWGRAWRTAGPRRSRRHR